MPAKQSGKRRTKKKQAKRIQQKKTSEGFFVSDDEAVELRRINAAKEAARVRRVDLTDEFRGVYEVSSTQWDHPYRVEIRHLTEPLNTCSCQDSRMNRLGTCKHIERVFQFMTHRRKRRFRQSAKAGGRCYDIFFDVRENPPRLRMIRPAAPSPTVEKALAPFFGDDGFLLADSLEGWRAVKRAVDRLGPSTRPRVRLSGHAGYWLEREQRLRKSEEMRRHFDRDVAAGKRSDNPVLLPLYPYQKQGMRHLAFTGRALLADDMGLGKTVQAIAAAELLRTMNRVSRVLIVCPASLKAEWDDQLRKFTGRHAHLVYGSRAKRLEAYAEAPDYLVCNYEQVRGDVEDLNRLLAPDLVILDEAQRIKNWPTKTAKAIKRLDSTFAFVLTGTPLENRIEELYSLVEFIDPHIFGSLFRFQRDYMAPDEGGEIGPHNLGRLHRTVSRIMLRRRKSDIEDTLPDRTDKTFLTPMTPEQKRRYADFAYEASILASIAQRRPLRPEEHERLMRLLACMRMTCDTPYILDAKCRDCPKLEELENILDEELDAPEVKILIFSEWVRMLDLVAELLQARGVGYAEHTGRIPQQKRREQIHSFKNYPACRVFLSSESGGSGLNLQAASVVINLDLPWNPAKLEQRIARAWRKHQGRSVRVLNLVAEDTIEQEMIGKLSYKQALSDSVLDGAAVPEKPKSKSARRDFAARVGELLGLPEQGPEPEPSEQTAAKQAAHPLDELKARHPDAIIGVESHRDSGDLLVIARPGRSFEEVQTTAASLADARVEVITPEMKTVLDRLRERGMLSFSAELETLYAGDGYQPVLEPDPPAPTLYSAAAIAHWSEGDDERKAVAALADLGLTGQATPHIAASLRRGREALRILYCGDGGGDGPLPEHADREHTSLLSAIDDVQETPGPSAHYTYTGRILIRRIDEALRSVAG